MALPVLRRGEGFGLGLGLGSQSPPSTVAPAGGSSQEAAGEGVERCPRRTGEKAAPGEPDTAGTSDEEMTVGGPARAAHHVKCQGLRR